MKKRSVKFILLAGFVGLFLYTVFSNIKKTNVVTTVKPRPTEILTLKEAVESALTDTEGTYGIVVKNLQTGQSYYYNQHKSFEVASLYKIWVLATAFEQIKKGRLQENEVLSQEISILNEKFHISSESAEMTEGQITLTVKEAMEKMIIISHNYAALLLSERVKLSTVRAFLQEHEFNESALGEPPKTTPYDIALFFEKLYKGELTNQEHTDKMLDILKRQTLNNKLPKDLPQDAIVAHKTGEIGYFSHDAGIVYTPKSNYIIVVLSESVLPSQADERIASISRVVYDYFTKRE